MGAGHLGDECGGLVDGDACRGDVQRAAGMAATHGSGVDSCAERVFGDTDHGYLEHVGTQAGPPVRIEINYPSTISKSSASASASTTRIGGNSRLTKLPGSYEVDQRRTLRCGCVAGR
jgi:hypothetical protein